MKIKDIIDKSIMATNLDADSKDEAIDKMAHILLDAGYINDIESYKKDIYYRETLGATGIGDYIAIPHGQSASVVKNGIAIGIVKTAQKYHAEKEQIINQISDELNVSHQEAETIYSEVEEYIKTSQEEK